MATDTGLATMDAAVPQTPTTAILSAHHNRPVIIRADPYGDLRPFIEHMWLTRPETCRAVFLDMFPTVQNNQHVTKEQEDAFIERFFDCNTIQEQTPRFLKWVLHAIAQYNHDRISKCAEEWVKENYTLFNEEPHIRQIRDATSFHTLFHRNFVQDNHKDRPFLFRVMQLIQHDFDHYRVYASQVRNPSANGSEVHTQKATADISADTKGATVVVNGSSNNLHSKVSEGKTSSRPQTSGSNPPSSLSAGREARSRTASHSHLPPYQGEFPEGLMHPLQNMPPYSVYDPNQYPYTFPAPYFVQPTSTGHQIVFVSGMPIEDYPHPFGPGSARTENANGSRGQGGRGRGRGRGNHHAHQQPVVDPNSFSRVSPEQWRQQDRQDPFLQNPAPPRHHSGNWRHKENTSYPSNDRRDLSEGSPTPNNGRRKFSSYNVPAEKSKMASSGSKNKGQRPHVFAPNAISSLQHPELYCDARSIGSRAVVDHLAILGLPEDVADAVIIAAISAFVPGAVCRIKSAVPLKNGQRLVFVSFEPVGAARHVLQTVKTCIIGGAQVHFQVPKEYWTHPGAAAHSFAHPLQAFTMYPTHPANHYHELQRQMSNPFPDDHPSQSLSGDQPTHTNQQDLGSAVRLPLSPVVPGVTANAESTPGPSPIAGLLKDPETIRALNPYEDSLSEQLPFTNTGNRQVSELSAVKSQKGKKYKRKLAKATSTEQLGPEQEPDQSLVPNPHMNDQIELNSSTPEALSELAALTDHDNAVEAGQTSGQASSMRGGGQTISGLCYPSSAYEEVIEGYRLKTMRENKPNDSQETLKYYPDHANHDVLRVTKSAKPSKHPSDHLETAAKCFSNNYWGTAGVPEDLRKNMPSTLKDGVKLLHDLNHDMQNQIAVQAIRAKHQDGASTSSDQERDTVVAVPAFAQDSKAVLDAAGTQPASEADGSDMVITGARPSLSDTDYGKLYVLDAGLNDRQPVIANDHRQRTHSLDAEEAQQPKTPARNLSWSLKRDEDADDSFCTAAESPVSETAGAGQPHTIASHRSTAQKEAIMIQQDSGTLDGKDVIPTFEPVSIPDAELPEASIAKLHQTEIEKPQDRRDPVTLRTKAEQIKQGPRQTESLSPYGRQQQSKAKDKKSKSMKGKAKDKDNSKCDGIPAEARSATNPGKNSRTNLQSPRSAANVNLLALVPQNATKDSTTVQGFSAPKTPPLRPVDSDTTKSSKDGALMNQKSQGVVDGSAMGFQSPKGSEPLERQTEVPDLDTALGECGDRWETVKTDGVAPAPSRDSSPGKTIGSALNMLKGFVGLGSNQSHSEQSGQEPDTSSLKGSPEAQENLTSEPTLVPQSIFAQRVAPAEQLLLDNDIVAEMSKVAVPLPAPQHEAATATSRPGSPREVSTPAPKSKKKKNKKKKKGNQNAEDANGPPDSIDIIGDGIQDASQCHSTNIVTNGIGAQTIQSPKVEDDQAYITTSPMRNDSTTVSRENTPRRLQRPASSSVVQPPIRTLQARKQKSGTKSRNASMGGGSEASTPLLGETSAGDALLQNLIDVCGSGKEPRLFVIDKPSTKSGTAAKFQKTVQKTDQAPKFWIEESEEDEITKSQSKMKEMEHKERMTKLRKQQDHKGAEREQERWDKEVNEKSQGKLERTLAKHGLQLDESSTIKEVQTSPPGHTQRRPPSPGSESTVTDPFMQDLTPVASETTPPYKDRIREYHKLKDEGLGPFRDIIETDGVPEDSTLAHPAQMPTAEVVHGGLTLQEGMDSMLLYVDLHKDLGPHIPVDFKGEERLPPYWRIKALTYMAHTKILPGSSWQINGDIELRCIGPDGEPASVAERRKS